MTKEKIRRRVGVCVRERGRDSEGSSFEGPNLCADDADDDDDDDDEAGAGADAVALRQPEEEEEEEEEGASMSMQRSILSIIMMACLISSVASGISIGF